MKTKIIIFIIPLIFCIMFLASNGFANIPAPPVNQLLGQPDTLLNNLVEAECRACHDDPGFGGPSNPDRHHLLYGSPIVVGRCQNSGDSCLSDADCIGLNELCTGKTAASDPYADPTEPYDYACLSCHEQSTVGGVTNFLIERDCLECHAQVPGEASVHHLTGTAQGTDSPLGDPTRGDCTPCHGTIVDDYGDGHVIPTYAPSLVTPTVRNGTAAEQNIEGYRAGSCNYCHSTGTGTSAPGVDTASGVYVYKNRTLHHNSGVFKNRIGEYIDGGCELCHGEPETYNGDVAMLRNCEQCHGFESLHNIQADSPNPDNIGEIVVGGEDYGYGHIGRDNGPGDSDCWGCHGFAFPGASAPSTGPVTPYLSDSDKQVIVSGTDTTITLNGSSLTNMSGTTEFVSTFLLTSQDGSVIGITPVEISAFSSTIIIPGTTAPGNYQLTASKDSGAAISNPLPITIIPSIDIDTSTIRSSCGGCTGELTLTGSGFGDTPPAGAELYINVMQNNVPLNITSWSDTVITATGAFCDGSEITVNGLFGSATK